MGKVNVATDVATVVVDIIKNKLCKHAKGKLFNFEATSAQDLHYFSLQNFQASLLEMLFGTLCLNLEFNVKMDQSLAVLEQNHQEGFSSLIIAEHSVHVRGKYVHSTITKTLSSIVFQPWRVTVLP